MSREPPETSASMDHFHFSNPKIDSLSLFSNEQRTTWDQRLSVEKFPLNAMDHVHFLKSKKKFTFTFSVSVLHCAKHRGEREGNGGLQNHQHGNLEF